MKRNIKVSEKDLIDKMNYNISIDPATGESKTVTTVIDKEAGKAVDIMDSNDRVYANCKVGDDYFKDKTVAHDTVTLTPRNEDGTLVDGFEEYDDNEEDRRASRAAVDSNTIPTPNLQQSRENIVYKKYMSDPVNLRALKRALADVDKVEEEGLRLRTPNSDKAYVKTYEEVNHPQHYNNYDVEVIDMMEKVFGKEQTAVFCKLNAFKYRMRAGTKPGQDADKDLKKEQWYLNKKRELGF